MEINIAKGGFSVTVPDLTLETFETLHGPYIYNYGWKQTLNDAVAAVDAEAANAAAVCRALVDKKLERILSGKVSIREGGPRGDSVLVEAMVMSRKAVATRAKAEGKKYPDQKALNVAAMAYLEKNRDYVMGKAEQIVALRNEDIPLDDTALDGLVEASAEGLDVAA